MGIHDRLKVKNHTLGFVIDEQSIYFRMDNDSYNHFDANDHASKNMQFICLWCTGWL